MTVPDSVLVAGPVFVDAFADNIISALQGMGIRPLYDERQQRSGRWAALATLARELGERANLVLPNPHEKRLLDLARAHRPALFLAPTQAFGDEFLAQIKDCGVRYCAAWWGDAPGNMTRMGLLSRQWDVICLKDPDAVRKFRRVGLNAQLLHEAMNPEWHRVVAEQANQEVAIAGNFYGYRQFLAVELMKRGVELGLYGGRLPQWVAPEIARIHRRRYIVREEKSRVFGEAMACLNSTQIVEGNSMNCRAFEIAGAGGLQIMEQRPIIAECFEPGTEILTYDTLEELMAHVDRARRFPAEMRPIRAAAARRARECHTYRHRLETLFGMLAS